MAPEQELFYYRSKFKFVVQSSQVIGTSDDARDPEYVPPGT